jgi:hypothetical protein
MIVLMVTFTLGSAFLALATSSFFRGRNDLLRTQALNLAEAGVAKSIYNLRLDKSWLPLGSAETVSDIGSFLLTVSDGVGDNAGKLVIESTGTAAMGPRSVTRKLRAVLERKEEDLSIWNNVIFGGVGAAGHSITGNIVMRGSIHLLGDGEEYTDSDHDGHWDDNESYTDSNHNSQYDLGEPYTDTDGDGHRDAREAFNDVNGNGVREAPLTVTEQAGTFSGAANMGNNYEPIGAATTGMPSDLRAKVRPLGTRRFGGETVDYLDARLRVKHGRVDISGDATVGQTNAAAGTPTVKETMEGVFVSDGFGGSAGGSAVHSDNGTANHYDLDGLPEDKKVRFPTLQDAVRVNSVDYATHEAYLSAVGVHYTGNLIIERGIAGSISDVSGTNRLSWDASGNITISGIVYVDGNITFNHGNGSEDTFTYTGKGTVYSTGNINVHTNIVSAGLFPQVNGDGNAMGFVARQELHLGDGSGDSHLSLMGAFYAQNKIYSEKQNEITGTFVSSYFEMLNTPHMYQVPLLAKNLPPGMPGDKNITLIRTTVNSWRDMPH